MNWSIQDRGDQREIMHGVLQKAYREAEHVVAAESDIQESLELEEGVLRCVRELSETRHACRGALVTLMAYKCCDPSQDVRVHKTEYDGGFSARTYDSQVTIPFLAENDLPRSVESHWLTQTLSFAGPLNHDIELKTRPQKVGRIFLQALDTDNLDDTGSVASRILTVIFLSLIQIRNKSRVILTRPKNLSIDSVAALLVRHFDSPYKTNAPRLPQLAVYAIYECLIGSVSRYEKQVLEPLQRMKSADRKSGTVGDVVVLKDGAPIEAVEIKFDQPIRLISIREAIEKVRAENVSRYYVLSTGDHDPDAPADIESLVEMFRRQNGCEIIVNGVIKTISYYLRLMPETTSFVRNYTRLVETDEDVGYEHRSAWNEACRQI